MFFFLDTKSREPERGSHHVGMLDILLKTRDHKVTNLIQKVIFLLNPVTYFFFGFFTE